MASDDETVAGVVAFAAEDDDRAVDAQPLEHIDTTAAGVFHQHQAGDAVLFDRAAIDFAGLLAINDGRSRHIVLRFSVGGHAEYRGAAAAAVDSAWRPTLKSLSETDHHYKSRFRD